MTGPTRARHGVIGFTVALAVVTYIDRVAISQAAPFIRRDLGLSAIEMGWVFTAFSWAYALFEIPGGWLGDRLGARKALVRVVLWWSLFTAATGWVGGLASLLVMRALFGAGEAGCFPNITRAYASWLPPADRARAQGILWLAARWGGAFTPILVAVLRQHLSWRRVFEIFGLLGVVWALLWWRWFRDRPEEHPGVNAAERALLHGREAATAHGPVPWRMFLGSKTVWLLWGQYMCLGYGWAFYVTWLPTYLQEERGLSLERGALMAGVPLFFGGIGSILSGMLAQPLGRWLGDVGRGRRALAMLGCVGAALTLAISPGLASPVAAVVVMGLASLCNDLAMPPAWATCMDVGGRHAGTLAGSMNMMGNLTAGLAPVSVAFILQWTARDWAVTFYVGAALYALGAVCWWALRPDAAVDRAAARPISLTPAPQALDVP